LFRRRASLPPGPFAVPVLGNFINEIKPPLIHVGLKRLTAQFGPIFTVHLPFPVVNIADFETMRDAFRGNDATGRMHNVLIETARFCENGGIVTSDGADWQEQRTFAIATLRDFGMGKNLMEEKVRLSARNMIEFINKKDLSDVDLRWSIEVFVSNIINEFLFGFQFPFDDCGKLEKVMHSTPIKDTIHFRSKLVPIVFILPWIRHLPIISYFWGKHKQRLDRMMGYVREQAKAVKCEPNEEPTCFVQAFNANNKDKRFEQLLTCCSDLFNAGLETTTATLRWAMLLMAAHQEVQEKLRSEILSVIGRDRLASMADKAIMPYASAVVNEIQRKANIIAPSPVLFHRTTVDTQITGFKIPANTLLNGDFHQMMKADPLFEDPDRFWPERYIAEDGITLRKAQFLDLFDPYLLEKESASDSARARTELFIGLISLIQNFRILPLPGKMIDLEPIYSNIHFPKPHNFRLERI
ncbi:hypothetical protein PMAYCL1PPCAC_32724, partial [Pristionchus mayeri]